MPENQVSNEQLIISLYYHNELSLLEICALHKFSQRYVANVIVLSTIQQKEEELVVESIMNYVHNPKSLY